MPSRSRRRSSRLAALLARRSWRGEGSGAPRPCACAGAGADARCAADRGGRSSRLAEAVRADAPELAGHWQVARPLQAIIERWPANWLRARRIDLADRRNRLLATRRALGGASAARLHHRRRHHHLRAGGRGAARARRAAATRARSCFRRWLTLRLARRGMGRSGPGRRWPRGERNPSAISPEAAARPDRASRAARSSLARRGRRRPRRHARPRRRQCHDRRRLQRQMERAAARERR